jgi:hypothetical protein
MLVQQTWKLAGIADQFYLILETYTVREKSNYNYRNKSDVYEFTS